MFVQWSNYIPLYQTISKFEKYHDKFNIYYLNGGFSGALLQNIGVIETCPLSSNGGSSDGDNGSGSNGHRKTKSLSGFTLPSATNFKTKFVQSIKRITIMMWRRVVIRIKSFSVIYQMDQLMVLQTAISLTLLQV